MYDGLGLKALTDNREYYYRRKKKKLCTEIEKSVNDKYSYWAFAILIMRGAGHEDTFKMQCLGEKLY